MHTRRIDEAPTESRGRGQLSHLLLGPGDFGSENMCVTWVECAPDSQQDLHAHPDNEQAYVVIQGHGTMIVGEETLTVERGTLVFIPPRTDHAILASKGEPLIYVSATSPPFEANVADKNWQPLHQARASELR